MFWLQGGDLIASKDIGLVLRILGQNPTEDQIVEMVMKVSASGILGIRIGAIQI